LCGAIQLNKIEVVGGVVRGDRLIRVECLEVFCFLLGARGAR
jgi:hypothetical protein